MKKVKIIIDCMMVIFLPMLMSYALIGEAVHEWLGMIMFVLFIVHNILNRNWYKNIFKGRYTPYRIYVTIVDLSLCVIMFALPVSGILMSKHAFTFINLPGTASVSRSVHIVTAYWGFVLMSLHLGNHAKMIINGISKKSGKKNNSGILTNIGKVFICLTAVYGIYAFIKRKIVSYLFMQSMFAFFDYNESRVIFFSDHIAMMAMFAAAGYYIGKLLNKSNNNDQKFYSK